MKPLAFDRHEPPLREPPDEFDRAPIDRPAAKAMLQQLREHPHAPIFRNESGHRLRESDLPALAEFEQELRQSTLDLDVGAPWLRQHIDRVFREVPYYRGFGAVPSKLSDIAPISRALFQQDITRFVPDDVPAARMIQYSTSGTTGHRLILPSHPRVAACYRYFYERALAQVGVTLTACAPNVGLVLLGNQAACFTYVSSTPTRHDAGMVKLNLHPNDWQYPEHRGLYLDALAAELYSGDPLSFMGLLETQTRHCPKAMVSTSMTLSEGLRHTLTQRFGCPVLDLYSVNEAGPIAAYDPAVAGWRLLQSGLHVEILRADGSKAVAGEVGEITLTGGFNFCLPLVRYRTNDYASLQRVSGNWVLRDFSGRPSVRFQTKPGANFNNIDVTHALKSLPLAQWTLLQRADYAVEMQILPYSIELAEQARSLLTPLFTDLPILVSALTVGDHKPMQYRSELLDP